jgi:plasmid stability protein
MKQITIRHDSAELEKRLKARARSEGKSVNSLVLNVLEKAVGLGDRKEALKRYTTWTDEDLREFTTHLKAQRTIDAKLWK